MAKIRTFNKPFSILVRVPESSCRLVGILNKIELLPTTSYDKSDESRETAQSMHASEWKIIDVSPLTAGEIFVSGLVYHWRA